MLKLYDLNRVPVPLTKYQDLKIESVLSTNDKTLSFSVPLEYAKGIKEEYYLRTGTNEFVIKECSISGKNVNVTATLNIEELDGTLVTNFQSEGHTVRECMNLALIGTGWTVTCNLAKKRTIKLTNKYVWDIIKQVIKTYAVELIIDSIHKKLTFIENIGSNKGTYFTDQLNLKNLDIKSDTYDYYTRLIPTGKDGLTIESVNDGKNYIDNFQYSSKIRMYQWSDDRYADAQSLYDDATLKLGDMSKPYKSYSCDVIDLAKDGKHDIFSYSLGDIVILIDRDTSTREKQRIVKIVEYPDDYTKNSCELANTILSFEEMASKYEDTASTVNNITIDDGTVDGSTVDSIKTSQISDFSQAIIAEATITALQAQDVEISGNLSAVNARVGSLEVSALTATTADLKYAKIDLANISAGTIKTAMIDTAAIGTTQIADGSITDAKIVELTANKIHGGIIDASDIEVVNLKASNITVGTINGAQIAPGAIDMTNLATTLGLAITTAGDNANTALTAANSKNRIFYQTTAPAGTDYKTNDLWFDTDDGNKIYYWNGGSWTAEQFGTSAIASNAIDSTKLATAVNDTINTALTNAGLAQNAANSATTTANGKNKTYYAVTAPTGTVVIGDLWFNTGDGYKMYRWDGSTWLAASFGTNAIASGAVDSTKLTAAINTSISTANTNASTALTNATTAQSAANTALTNASTAQTTANGKNTVYYATTAPTATKVNDVWFNTADSNKMSYWNGTEWELSQLGTNAIANLSITNALIADATIASAKISALDAAKITTGTLSADRIAALSITAAKIAAGTITTTQIASSTIIAGNIASGAVTTDKLYALAVTGDKIAGNTITAVKMVAGTITAASGIIANAAIGTAQITDLAITGAKIASATITNANIADATINSAKIANLDAGKITAGILSVNRLELVGSTTSLVFALNNSGSLTSTVVNTLNGNVLTPRTITADKVVAGAITANEIAASTITGNKIVANTITVDKLSVSSLSAITANLGTVTAGILQSGNYAPDVSGMKLTLNTGVWDSKYFKLATDGSITATAGKIGAMSITTNGLVYYGTSSEYTAYMKCTADKASLGFAGGGMNGGASVICEYGLTTVTGQGGITMNSNTGPISLNGTQFDNGGYNTGKIMCSYTPSDNSNLNDFTESTWYGSVYTGINAPYTSWWYITNIRHRGGVSDGRSWGYQKIADLFSADTYERYQRGGTWTGWQHPPGTVRTTAGDIGTYGNGGWYGFEVGYGVNYRENPVISVIPTSGFSVENWRIVAISTSGCSLQIYTPNTSFYYGARWMAIGEV